MVFIYVWSLRHCYYKLRRGTGTPVPVEEPKLSTPPISAAILAEPAPAPAVPEKRSEKWYGLISWLVIAAVPISIAVLGMVMTKLKNEAPVSHRTPQPAVVPQPTPVIFAEPSPTPKFVVDSTPLPEPMVWREYQSKEFEFVVDMPGEVEDSAAPVPIKDFKVHIFFGGNDDDVVCIIVTAFPQDYIDWIKESTPSDRLVEMMMQGLKKTKSSEMTNVKQLRGKFLGYDALDMSGEAVMGGIRGYAYTRGFIAGNKGYAMIAITAHSPDHAFKLLDRMASSFTLVRPAKPVNAPPAAAPLPRTQKGRGA